MNIVPLLPLPHLLGHSHNDEDRSTVLEVNQSSEAVPLLLLLQVHLSCLDKNRFDVLEIEKRAAAEELVVGRSLPFLRNRLQ